MMRPTIPALALGAALLPFIASGPTVAREDPTTSQRQAAAAVDLAPDEIVRRANDTLNGITSLSAEFVQTNPDGKRLTGRMYLMRPGRLRFDYDAPSGLEVVADGRQVVVRDRKLKTSDSYPISQTPLDFLLRERMDLASMRLKGAVMTQNGASIHIENVSNLVGTSKVSLLFDAQVRNLVQWRVVDGQGRATVVSLSNATLEPDQFKDDRMFDVRFQIPQKP